MFGSFTSVIGSFTNMFVSTIMLGSFTGIIGSFTSIF